MMKSLFRGLEEKSREQVIKSNLIEELKKNVKELLEEQEEEGVLRSCDASNALSTVLEAIFIHGLKETLVSKFSSVMAGPDQVPEPEFWSILLVFSHRDIIRQIQKLSQITTDIGRCRAWIRLALNDSLLPSYVDSIIAQNSALLPYYKKTAFLRDLKMLHNLKLEVTSVSSILFEFPMNSCLLNYWPTGPLLMAGLWTPPMKLTNENVTMDVASDIAAELVDQVTLEIQTPYISIQEPVIYDEEEALKIILGTPVQDSLLKSLQENVSERAESSEISTRIDVGNGGLNSTSVSHLIETQTDFYLVRQDQSGSEQNVSSEKEEKLEETDVCLSPVERRESIQSESYDVLLKSYNTTTSHSDNYNDLIQNYSPISSSPVDKQANLDNILQTYDLMADVVQPASVKSTDPMSASMVIEQDLRSMVDHLGKLMSEKGLISQNFICKKCDRHIGITFAPAKVCALTGHYYCIECFDEKESVIPARILHNWDFSKHFVSGKAHHFLCDVQAHPLINIRKVNPKLYVIVPEMEKLQRQRMQLNLLRLYLMTCRQPVIEALKKQLWPREYLYEHIHLYSISDLLQIPSSQLSQTLTEVIRFCEYHVLNCNLCSQKGFICELCNSKKIIYPFHLDSTYRCTKCGSVVHSTCKTEVEQCRKCLRLQERTN